LHLIIGLGNPGARYAQTRHNIGWLAVERAARRWSIRFEASITARKGTGRVGRDEVLLATPLGWMNQNGPIVRVLLDEAALAPRNLIVVHDDLDLGLGRLRIKFDGGTGGHNGILSITDALESQDFYRLKIGIGRPIPGLEAADYVLSPFTSSEMPVLDEALEQAVTALECFLAEGAGAAMNRFNVRMKANEPPADGGEIEQD
jgi:PTH1 family peptidyl-tRNA hydrolase